MNQQITRLAPHQNGKVAGALLGVVSLPLVVFVHLLLTFTTPMADQSSFALDFPFFMFLLFPILYFMKGYTSVAFACFAYNFLYQYIGGFEFEMPAGASNGQRPQGQQQKAVKLIKRISILTVLLGISAYVGYQSAVISGQQATDTPSSAAQKRAVVQQIDCGSINGFSLPCWEDYLSDDGFEGSESLPYYPFAKRPNGCSFPRTISGTNDVIEVAGLAIRFTDICNEHDRCYYTLGTTPWECNSPFQNSLRAGVCSNS